MKSSSMVLKRFPVYALKVLREFEVAKEFLYLAADKLKRMEDFYDECEDYCLLLYLSAGLERFEKICPRSGEKNLFNQEEENLIYLASFFREKNSHNRKYIQKTEYRESRILLLRFIEDNLETDKKEGLAAGYDQIKGHLYTMICSIEQKYCKELRKEYTGKGTRISPEQFTIDLPSYEECRCTRLERRAAMELFLFLLRYQGNDTQYVEYLRGIEPLPFNIRLIPEYLVDLCGKTIPLEMVREVENFYETQGVKDTRSAQMDLLMEKGLAFKGKERK